MSKKSGDPPQEQQAKLIGLLNRRLADAIDLQLQCRQAYWNVKGPHFMVLRELFDKVAEAGEGYADLIAMRLVQLGGVAEGTAQAAARRSSLDKHEPAALSATLIEFGKHVRYASEQATLLQDVDTADLFSEIARDVDRWVRFVQTSQQAGS